MGTKYIIEVEDKPFELLSEYGFTSEKLYRVKGFNSLVFDWNGLNMLTPYTEPDLEQVRKEAYEKWYDDATVEIGSDEQAIAEKAYQKGLSDAWGAAKKICMSVDEGGLSSSDICKIFNVDFYRDAMKNFSPLKAVEKIKAYEQGIAIGDEVVFYNGEKCVVTVVEDEQVVEVMDENGFSMKMDDGLRDSMKKTGRHFEELVTILKKMKVE